METSLRRPIVVNWDVAEVEYDDRADHVERPIIAPPDVVAGTPDTERGPLWVEKQREELRKQLAYVQQDIVRRMERAVWASADSCRFALGDVVHRIEEARALAVALQSVDIPALAVAERARCRPVLVSTSQEAVDALRQMIEHDLRHGRK